MSASQEMPGPDGTTVRAYRRGIRQVCTGDYLPEHGAYVVAPAVEDPDDGCYWLTLDDGRDIRVTTRKLWLWRRYARPQWMTDALEAYRAARDARDAARESGAIIPAGAVTGASGGAVAWYQLEESDFRAAWPAPRLADHIREAAAAWREEK